MRDVGSRGHASSLTRSLAKRRTRLQQGLSLVTVVLASLAILSPAVHGTPPSDKPTEPSGRPTALFGRATELFGNPTELSGKPTELSGRPASDECGDFAAGTTLSQCGFETPALAVTSFIYGTTGSAWSFMGLSGISSNRSGFTGPQSAPEGGQVVFLQGTGSASQSIDGFVAGSYTLTFSAAQRSNFGGRQDFAVRLDDVVLGVFEPAGYKYRDMSMQFVATSGTHTLEFVGLNTLGGDDTAFIDKIRLVRREVSLIDGAHFVETSGWPPY